MKFSELNEEAKIKASKDYIKGWKETHPKESFTIEQGKEFCLDSEDDVEYNSEGDIIE